MVIHRNYRDGGTAELLWPRLLCVGDWCVYVSLFHDPIKHTRDIMQFLIPEAGCRILGSEFAFVCVTLQLSMHCSQCRRLYNSHSLNANYSLIQN
ncbi:hypothetical protein OUZ56_012723 [Daphnia magna]|uniref:Uncharacterized protein n=1 Tax=Daphnia magna TaxID=35525 RepID=A0ABQ9Z405_9CRUS|nr:hypothetical protein OUZ56_012723 [Daphnia magna]